MNRIEAGAALIALLVFAAALALGAGDLHARTAPKVDVCHVDDEGAFRIINISENALEAHMAHGDRMPAEYYLDGDGDGYGVGSDSVTACTQPAGYSDVAGDCDDTRADIHPGAEDLCDSLDNDCDGVVDEDQPPADYYLDEDGDGYGVGTDSVTACTQPAGYSDVAGDCDDSRADVYPGAEEVCDELDNDCDGVVDEDVCGCATCETTDDCESGVCHNGACQPTIADGVQPVELVDGSTIDAYVGCDDYVLLAHYGAGGRITFYDQRVAQTSSVSGGGAAPSGFYPTLVGSGYGHLAMLGFDPAGLDVRMECVEAPGEAVFAVDSSSLFDSFGSSTKGTYGDVGAPGWGYSATYRSGQGRSSHAACGAVVSWGAGGISYCSGPGWGYYWGNHLVSYYSTNYTDSPYLGCNGTGENGPDSDAEVWVWLEQ